MAPAGNEGDEIDIAVSDDENQDTADGMQPLDESEDSGASLSVPNGVDTSEASEDGAEVTPEAVSASEERGAHGHSSPNELEEEEDDAPPSLPESTSTANASTVPEPGANGASEHRSTSPTPAEQSNPSQLGATKGSTVDEMEEEGDDDTQPSYSGKAPAAVMYLNGGGDVASADDVDVSSPDADC